MKKPDVPELAQALRDYSVLPMAAKAAASGAPLPKPETNPLSFAGSKAAAKRGKR